MGEPFRGNVKPLIPPNNRGDLHGIASVIRAHLDDRATQMRRICELIPNERRGPHRGCCEMHADLRAITSRITQSVLRFLMILVRHVTTACVHVDEAYDAYVVPLKLYKYCIHVRINIFEAFMLYMYM